MESKETNRLEAFSDGVIAIAITLLILEIKVPTDLPEGTGLWNALARLWPSYLALVTSFTLILILWINHHRMFIHIWRTDTTLFLLNGGVLLCITTLPFTTALVAEYLQKPEAQIAAIIYNGNFIVMAIFFNSLWLYATYKDRLLNPAADQAGVKALTRQYRFGIPGYVIILLISLINFPISLALSIAMAVFFTFPSRRAQVSPEGEP